MTGVSSFMSEGVNILIEKIRENFKGTAKATDGPKYPGTYMPKPYSQDFSTKPKNNEGFNSRQYGAFNDKEKAERYKNELIEKNKDNPSLHFDIDSNGKDGKHRVYGYRQSPDGKQAPDKGEVEGSDGQEFRSKF